MNVVRKKMLPRQRQLRVWLLEQQPQLDTKALAESCKVSISGLSNEFYRRESMKADVHAACIKAGIPAELLPPPTRPKAVLLRENLELRERLAAAEGRLASLGSPQALAG